MSSWWLFAHFTTIVGFVLAIALAGRMLRQRRSPGATAAWLLAIVLLPWVGVPAYLVLASRAAVPGGRSRRVSSGPGDLAEPISSTDRLLRAHGAAPASAGNRFSLCATGEDAYRELVGLIDAAQQRIQITIFILHPDEVGRDVIARLARRAEQGVQVRLLLDRLGSFTTSKADVAPLVDAGGQVASFGPLLRHPFGGAANQRNHRKAVVVDGAHALSGGINIASEYIGPEPKADRWRDLAFVVAGAAARRMEEICIADWNAATGEGLVLEPSPTTEAMASRPEGAAVQVVASGPDAPGDPLYAAILSSVFASTRRVWAVTPYFVPDDGLCRALVLAAERGVDVRLLVPEVSNHRLADLARGTYLREVQAAGGKILLYTGGMVHAKLLIVDDEFAMTGSANLDLRSLQLNYELSTFLYAASEVEAVAEWFEALAAGCRQGEAEPGWARDLAEGVVRIAAPLL